MKNKYFILLLILLPSISILAQSPIEKKRNYFLGSYYSQIFLQGELKENIGNLDDQGTIDLSRNVGFTISGLFQSKRDDWLYMGFDYSMYMLDFELDSFGDYDVTTTNSFTTAHYKVHLRYDLNSFTQPYVEGMLGAQYFYTRTVREDFTEDNVFRAGDLDRGDLAASFGGGVGVQLRLARGFYFDTSLSYLRGTPTEYLVRLDNPPLGQDPIDTFEPKTSNTDMLVLRIGLQIGRGR